jgi:hypothetical protein
LRAVNIKQLSPKEENTSIYYIFERLNTGGTPLTSQEIRNCVFRGDIVSILRKLNTDSNWRRIIGKKNIDKHQKDVELVLRLLALFQNAVNYEKPMKKFLNDNMQINRKGDTPKINKFIQLFPKATKLIIETLGEKPFHIRGPLNASVLDAVFTVAIESIDLIDKNFAEHYQSLVEDDNFLKYTQLGTTDTSSVKGRYKYAKKQLMRK